MMDLQTLLELPRLTTKAALDEQVENRVAMEELVKELRSRSSEMLYQGKAKAQAQHLSRGMLLARDRVALCLDDDSPFLELCSFAGYDQEGMTPSASIVSGIGIVCGTVCMVSAGIPTIAGGAINQASVMKSERLSETSSMNRLPTIQLVQSAGANLAQQFDVFHAGGKMFRDLAIRSLDKLPSCSVVFGSSTAGGAYQPGMSDYAIMVKGQAQMFLGGPPLVKMATGEETTAEELGGADTHSRKSGVSDQLATDEFDAIAKAREWVAGLNWKTAKNKRLPIVREPVYPIEDILSIAQANIKKPWDMMELICRIVDDSRFSSFKPLYGPNLCCGWGYIGGWPVGIIANNNVLFPAEAQKATQFIRLCNTREVPIIFLHNITGFMVGRQYEEAGMIKAGSLMIAAVTNSTVPHISIICGASYGAGNYAMCGRAYRPRFLFSWPTARCSVMGGEQLAGVMDIVAREGSARVGKAVDEEKLSMQKALLTQSVGDQSDVYYTSSRLLDDGIIDPRETRNVLIMSLGVVNLQEIKGNPVMAGISRI